MISMILFALAAICNAAGDTLVHRYTTSVFNKLDPTFWNPAISWKNKYVNGQRRKLIGPINYPVQLTDAWHLFKSLMLTFVGFAIAYHVPMCHPLIDTLIYLAIWWFFFEAFYTYALRKNNIG
jgi:hypothetical protein